MQVTAPPSRFSVVQARRPLLRFALAHHPTCTNFASHVLVARLGHRQAPLCIGCIAFWPAFLAGVPLLVWLSVGLGVPWWLLGVGGIALSGVQALSYAGRVRARAGRIMLKATLGMAVAAVACAVVLAPWHGSVRLVAGLGAVAAYGALQMLRLRKTLATCTACPWRKEWQFCPGFAPLNDHAPDRLPTQGPGAQGPLPQAWPWDGHAVGGGALPAQPEAPATAPPGPGRGRRE